MPLIIFDFDGTLADTKSSIVETMQLTFEKLGYERQPEDVITNSIGLPLIECLMVAKGMTREDALKGTVIYRDIFMSVALHHVRLFPDVMDVIETLSQRGIPMAVATSRNQESLESLVDMLGLGKYLTNLFGEGHVKRGKPYPDLAEFIMDKLGADPSQTLVIGDTIYDLEMGKAAGCYTCGVTYGNHSKEKLSQAKPDYIIDSLKEIL